jgi:hypothetical protein
LLLIAGASLTHLQHTHLWISFSGRMGRLLLSPAHHQIHHSTRPIHFNRNFGSTIALWDALFGTLHVPAKKREKLTFGVDGLGYDPHSAKGGMLMPIADAWGELRVAAVGLAARLRPRPAALMAPTPLASAERSHALLD